ncbi:hypothetical protein IWQ60_011907 [Tieghemiomyces parasiticus]|uniref:Autophagy-related protein 14 n=1 Tax=Tieghemiomyces parasiticus TaxID=78921 RepID=A0A9W7ZIR9_9FUNG|nr:hypothetical protein IWQ60_011907 [Tieghemiomyces parasiticus]
MNRGYRVAKHRKRLTRIKKKKKIAVRSVTMLLTSGPLQHSRKTIELQDAKRRAGALEAQIETMRRHLSEERESLRERRKAFEVRQDRLRRVRAQAVKDRRHWMALYDLTMPSTSNATLDSSIDANPAEATTDPFASLFTKVPDPYLAEAARLDRSLDKGQRMLAVELLFIFDLKLVRIRASSASFQAPGDGLVAHVGSLLWPTANEWHKFPADYVNACLGYALHLLDTLVRYYDVPLPFVFTIAGAETVIFPNWTRRRKEIVPLYMTDHNLDRFAIGLSMFNYNVLYLCSLQGLDIPLSMVSQSAMNLRAACLKSLPREASELRPYPPSTQFAHGFYEVVRHTLELYTRDPSIPSKATAYLRELRFCEDDMDQFEREDEEKWDIIDNEGRTVSFNELSE